MTATDLYLDLLARALTRALYEDNDQIVGLDNHWHAGRSWKLVAAKQLGRALDRAGLELVLRRPYDPDQRERGRDWPSRAESMGGLMRMANARMCIESVIADGVPGDIVETGVWRGGMAIFMRGVLKAHGVLDRNVWLADSFEGLPPPDTTRYPADAGWDFERFDFLSAGVHEVRRNFERYQLLDDQVKFVVGFFKDTLPVAPIERLAVLRLDGDLYESTIQALEPLYPKLSVGGYCIVDDYGRIDACARAIQDFRAAAGIADELVDIDGSGVYWRKSS
jgi:O-methyltransferase